MRVRVCPDFTLWSSRLKQLQGFFFGVFLILMAVLVLKLWPLAHCCISGRTTGCKMAAWRLPTSAFSGLPLCDRMWITVGLIMRARWRGLPPMHFLYMCTQWRETIGDGDKKSLVSLVQHYLLFHIFFSVYLDFSSFFFTKVLKAWSSLCGLNCPYVWFLFLFFTDLIVFRLPILWTLAVCLANSHSLCT